MTPLLLLLVTITWLFPHQVLSQHPTTDRVSTGSTTTASLGTSNTNNSVINIGDSFFLQSLRRGDPNTLNDFSQLRHTVNTPMQLLNHFRTVGRSRNPLFNMFNIWHTMAVARGLIPNSIALSPGVSNRVPTLTNSNGTNSILSPRTSQFSANPSTNQFRSLSRPWVHQRASAITRERLETANRRLLNDSDETIDSSSKSDNRTNANSVLSNPNTLQNTVTNGMNNLTRNQVTITDTTEPVREAVAGGIRERMTVPLVIANITDLGLFSTTESGNNEVNKTFVWGTTVPTHIESTRNGIQTNTRQLGPRKTLPVNTENTNNSIIAENISGNFLSDDSGRPNTLLSNSSITDFIESKSISPTRHTSGVVTAKTSDPGRFLTANTLNPVAFMPRNTGNSVLGSILRNEIPDNAQQRETTLQNRTMSSNASGNNIIDVNVVADSVDLPVYDFVLQRVSDIVTQHGVVPQNYNDQLVGDLIQTLGIRQNELLPVVTDRFHPRAERGRPISIEQKVGDGKGVVVKYVGDITLKKGDNLTLQYIGDVVTRNGVSNVLLPVNVSIVENASTANVTEDNVNINVTDLPSAAFSDITMPQMSDTNASMLNPGEVISPGITRGFMTTRTTTDSQPVKDDFNAFVGSENQRINKGAIDHDRQPFELGIFLGMTDSGNLKMIHDISSFLGFRGVNIHAVDLSSSQLELPVVLMKLLRNNLQDINTASKTLDELSVTTDTTKAREVNDKVDSGTFGRSGTVANVDLSNDQTFTNWLGGRRVDQRWVNGVDMASTEGNMPVDSNVTFLKGGNSTRNTPAISTGVKRVKVLNASLG